MRIITTILVLLVFTLTQVAAQDFTVQRSDSTAVIEGETYVIHVVEPKQTLFSIAKEYEVKLSRIAFDNPGVLDGLKLHQPLKILQSAIGETKPVELTEETLNLDGNYVLYTVPKQKTLYAISKEYNTTISAILDANPTLSDGLKVGETIRIPTPKIFGDESAAHTEKGEVKMEMVGLPDIVTNIKIPLVLDTVCQTKLNIALLLPLYLDLNDTLITNRTEEEPEQIYRRSEVALEFYEGFLMALDTLHRLGYQVNLKVIDTENRPWKMKNLVHDGALAGSDVIIGPFYSKVFAEVSDYALQNCIPLVSPTIKGNAILTNNPYVFKIIPSDEALICEMGRYLAHSDSTNNLILHYGSGDEQKMLNQFRKGLAAKDSVFVPFPAYNVNELHADSIRNKLSLTQRNNVVFLSNNQVKLAGLVRQLSNLTEDARIVGFAPPTWTQFKNIEIGHFDVLSMHVPLAFFIEYTQPEVELFIQKFRAKFNAEPSTFAFRGYDLAMHFIKNAQGIKKHGVAHMLQVEDKGFQSVFRWTKLPNGGFENARGTIVDYSELRLKAAVQ